MWVQSVGSSGTDSSSIQKKKKQTTTLDEFPEALQWSNTKRILLLFVIDKEETAGCFSFMYLQLEVLEDAAAAAAAGTETNHSD